MTICITLKTKNENPAESSRFEAVYNISSSAIDRREVLGVAVDEWIVSTASIVSGV